DPSRGRRTEICPWLSTWAHARVATYSPKARSGSLVGAPPILIQCPLTQCPLNVSNAVRVCSSAVEGVEAVFGHGRRDAQIPVLGDQTGQIELPGEADPDHARTAFQRGDPVRAEGAIVETAPVAQAGAVGTEAQGRNEDEVEADLRREQLRGTEQLGVLMRLPDAPSALRLQARHRPGDPPESQRSADLRDHGQIDGPSGGEESIECGVEVRLSRQRRIGEKGPDRARADEVPRR